MPRPVRKKTATVSIEKNAEEAPADPLKPAQAVRTKKQYGRKAKEEKVPTEAESQGCKRSRRARRPPPPPFSELFIGAKENTPDLFDELLPPKVRNTKLLFFMVGITILTSFDTLNFM